MKDMEMYNILNDILYYLRRIAQALEKREHKCSKCSKQQQDDEDMYTRMKNTAEKMFERDLWDIVYKVYNENPEMIVKKIEEFLKLRDEVMRIIDEKYGKKEGGGE